MSVSTLCHTKEVKLESCHDLIVLSACSLMPNGSSGAAQVLALWWRGSCLYGVLEVLPTPSGHSVRELYEGGALLGASARAWTSLACAGGGCCAALEDLRVIACDPRCTCEALTLTATCSMDSHGCVPGTPHSSD